ncbi:MAG: branched-chain amino acid transporter permease [Microbacteriaceae bacterium]|jgi:branched-subunit amino acid ABC-type transport system permease component|nr:branched-chain amino acid transporter permease [Microbacteriaceae bacterium]
MVKALRGNPVGIRLLLCILALLLAAGALALGSSSAARADTTPSPTPTASAAQETIQVWVRLASDKSAVAGVTVVVTGPKNFSQSFVTGADGKVLVGVPRIGDYKVKLDVSTLPDKTLKPAINPLDTPVARNDSGDPAYFLLVPGTASGSGGSGGSTASPSPGSGSSSGDSTNYFALVANLTANGIIFGLLLALASIGVSLIYGTTGLNNFAHGELVTFGALMGYVLSQVLHLPIFIAIIGAFVLGGAFGYLQDMALWKPLRKRGVGLIPLMIVSIGLSLALRYLYEFIFGSDQLILSSNNASALTLGPVHFKQTDLISIVVCVVLLLAVAFVLLRTRIGKATRAVSDNKALAAASGINVERIIRIVWAGSGALAGLAGVLIGYYQTLRWDTGASILLLVFAAVTLGGFGTAFGALVGALIIGLLVNLSTLIIPANLQNAAALLVMILILLVRPQGIFGKRERIG